MQPDTTPSSIEADAPSREELIAMAREADPFGDDGRLMSLAMLTPGTLERFAALVAAREREACAQVCRHAMQCAHTHAVKAPDGVECANCINEAKAKGDTHGPL